MPSRLDFCDYLQPPDVPPDPVGDEWRGPQGFPGPPGPPGPAGPTGGGGTNVKDFGAKGDGVADDTAAVQAAANAAQGRALVLPAGIYSIAGLTLPTGVCVRGDGRGATTIRQRANLGAGWFITNVTPPVANIEIHDLTVDGADFTAQALVYLLQCSHPVIDNIEVMNSPQGTGLFIDGNGVPTTRGGFVRAIFSHNNGMAVWFGHAQRQLMVDGVHSLNDGAAIPSPGCAVYLDVSENLVSNVFVDSTNTGAHGIYIHNVMHCSYTNLVATRCARHGILVETMAYSYGANWRSQENSNEHVDSYSDIHFNNVAGNYGVTNDTIISGIEVGPSQWLGSNHFELFGINIEDGVVGPLKLLNVHFRASAFYFPYRRPAAQGLIVIDASTTNRTALASGTGTPLPLYNVASLYTSTADVVTAATADTSVLGTTGIGSKTVPASTLTAGAKFQITASGLYTTPAANTATAGWKILWGGTTIVSFGGAAVGVNTTAVIRLEAAVTVRSVSGATATVVVSGTMFIGNGAIAAGGATFGFASPSPVTVTANADQVLDATFVWSLVSGGQTATWVNGSVESVN